MTVFIVSLLIALSQAQRQGWDASYIRRLFLTAGVAFALFLELEFSRKEPLVELRVYKNFAVSAASLAILINAMNLWGTNFFKPPRLQLL